MRPLLITVMLCHHSASSSHESHKHTNEQTNKQPATEEEDKIGWLIK
jgi:hypothetical protein